MADDRPVLLDHDVGPRLLRGELDDLLPDAFIRHRVGTGGEPARSLGDLALGGGEEGCILGPRRTDRAGLLTHRGDQSMMAGPPSGAQPKMTSTVGAGAVCRRVVQASPSIVTVFVAAS